MLASSPIFPRQRLVGPCIGVAAVGLFLLNTLVPIYRPIDDAYISFRYAKNVVQGHGLVWNPGEAPIEGYTNFLLIALEIPFIATGVDPMLAAKGIGIVSTLLTGMLVFLLLRRPGHSWTRAGPFVAAGLFLNIPFISKHAMMGLETMLFALLLMLEAWLLVRSLDAAANGKNVRDVARTTFLAAGGAGFFAGLSRPEGVAVGGMMLGMTALLLSLSAPRGTRAKSLVRFAALGLLTFGIPTICYNAWRYWYFGDLYPNSYYIKVFALQGKRCPGARFLVAFLKQPSTIFFLLAAALRKRWHRRDLIFALPVVFSSLFYLSSGHQMAGGHRYFTPFVPFFVLIGGAGLIERLSSKNRVQQRIAVLVVTVFAVLACLLPGRFYEDAIEGRGWKPPAGGETHFMVGKLMGTLPERHSLTVICGDAGAIAYFSEVKLIDPVGLNDNFIARNATKKKSLLIDYLFRQEADIWFLSKTGASFLKGGHGPLSGMGERIYRDKRFRRYRYAAGFAKNSGGRYQYQVFVRKDNEHVDAITRILKSRANAPWK